LKLHPRTQVGLVSTRYPLSKAGSDANYRTVVKKCTVRKYAVFQKIMLNAKVY